MIPAALIAAAKTEIASSIAKNIGNVAKNIAKLLGVKTAIPRINDKDRHAVAMSASQIVEKQLKDLGLTSAQDIDELRRLTLDYVLAPNANPGAKTTKLQMQSGLMNDKTVKEIAYDGFQYLLQDSVATEAGIQDRVNTYLNNVIARFLDSKGIKQSSPGVAAPGQSVVSTATFAGAGAAILVALAAVIYWLGWGRH